MEIEIWKDVIGYEGFYQVSNFGRVKSLSNKRLFGRYYGIDKERILKQGLFKGYFKVKLQYGKKKTISVHRLVAVAFLDRSDENTEVNHKDGNSENNHVSNLEWISHSENVKHAFRLGLMKPNNINLGKFGYKSTRGKEVIKMDLFNNEIERYGSGRDAARRNGLNQCRISECARAMNKTYNGFIWKYA